MQVDFGQWQKLTHIAIQGQDNSLNRIVTFMLYFSNDGIHWGLHESCDATVSQR